MSCFNPRPSLPRGASSLKLISAHRIIKFQSSPLVAEGRVDNAQSYFQTAIRFNPRPSLPRGASETSFCTAPISSSFNPRPSLPRGASAYVEGFAGCNGVSILAPRCRGARPSNAPTSVEQKTVSILAPRCRGARRCRGELAGRGRGVSILAPRCRGARHLRSGNAHQFRGVSILAPRCRGARPCGSLVLLNSSVFQSSPLVAEGRVGSPSPSALTHELFQSSPLVAEGRVVAAWSSAT